MPTNGDFIQRHAEAVSLHHKVSVMHLISDKNISNSYIDIKTINNVTTCIGYVKHTSNPILKMIRFYKIYKQLLKRIGAFELIHLNVLFPFGVFALHQKFFKKKPYIITEHWTGYQLTKDHNIPFLQRCISSKITKNAAVISPVSFQLQKSMQKIGLKGTYVPIGNTIDTDIFKQENPKDKLFTIIHISSLHNQQKNISGMLRVAKKLENHIDNFTWKFVGGSIKNYNNEIAKLDLKSNTVQFIEHVSQNELSKHIQKAHVCVSFSNYETFGITVTEAIACGTFVISTNTGILAETPKEDFFSIIPIGDEDALLYEIIRQKNKKSTFNIQGMNQYISQKFSPKVIANQFSELYLKTLNNNS